MTAHDAPRTDERAGLSEAEVGALVRDALSHRRRVGARYCESCVEGVERLADALAAAVARAEAAEARVAAIETALSNIDTAHRTSAYSGYVLGRKHACDAIRAALAPTTGAAS